MCQLSARELGARKEQDNKILDLDAVWVDNKQIVTGQGSGEEGEAGLVDGPPGFTGEVRMEMSHPETFGIDHMQEGSKAIIRLQKEPVKTTLFPPVTWSSGGQGKPPFEALPAPSHCQLDLA